MCLCVCECWCACVCACLSASAGVSVSVRVCLRVLVCLCLCVSVCVCLCLCTGGRGVSCVPSPYVLVCRSMCLRDCVQGLTPAVSFQHPASFRINFGDRPFAQVVPHGFRSVRTWYQRESEYTFARAAASFGKIGALLPTSYDSGAIIDGTLATSTAEGAVMGAGGILLTRGKWYWEARITAAGQGCLGWCDLEHLRTCASSTIGDSRHSWAFDGGRRVFVSNGRQVPWGRHWQVGDVVGVAADLDNRKLMVGAMCSVCLCVSVCLCLCVSVCVVL